MIKKLILITTLFSTYLFAQQTNLTIEVQPVTDSGANWETTLSWSTQNAVETGVLFELPTGLKMVPLAVRINQNDMLLQNTSETPSDESVVSWDLSPQGIMLFFRPGQINSGDQIEVKTMSTLIKNHLDENPTITMRAVQKNNQDLQISETIESSANITLEIEN
jgi:hypothetical protein